MNHRSYRIIAGLTLVSFLLSCTGCVHTRILRQETPDGPELTVEFQVFPRKAERKAGGPVIPGVLSELYVHQEDGWYLLYRSQEGRWSLPNLVPGRYRIVTDRRYDPESGEVEELSGDTEHEFRLGAGETARIEVILEKTPVGLIVVLSVTIVALVVVAVLLAQDGLDLDWLIPDPGSLVPPPDVLLPSVFVPPLPDPFHLTSPPLHGGLFIDPGPVVILGEPSADLSARPAPVITDYGPRDDSVDVAPGEPIWMTFSREMDRRGFDPRNVVVTVGDAAVLAGLRYDRETRSLKVRPLHPLPEGEQITVTVHAEGLRSAEDVPVELSYRWSFTTAA